MHLYWVDIAIVTIIVLSVLTGLFRGFVKESISLCVWILAAWLGANYSSVLDPWLSAYISEPVLRHAVAFGIIFIGTLFVGGIVNTLMSAMLRRTGLSGTDRILGMGFGFVRGVFIVALIMVAVKLTSLPYNQYSNESKLYAQFDPVVAFIDAHLPEFIKRVKKVDSTERIIDTIPLS